MPSALSEVFSSLVPLRAGDEAKACPERKYGCSQQLKTYIGLFTYLLVSQTITSAKFKNKTKGEIYV